MSGFLACDRFRVSCKPEQVEKILEGSGYEPVIEENPSYSGSKQEPQEGHFQRGGVYVEVVPLGGSRSVRKKNGEDARAFVYLGVKYITGRTGPFDKNACQIMDEARRQLEEKLSLGVFDIGKVENLVS